MTNRSNNDSLIEFFKKLNMDFTSHHRNFFDFKKVFDQVWFEAIL